MGRITQVLIMLLAVPAFVACGNNSGGPEATATFDACVGSDAAVGPFIGTAQITDSGTEGSMIFNLTQAGLCSSLTGTLTAVSGGNEAPTFSGSLAFTCPDGQVEPDEIVYDCELSGTGAPALACDPPADGNDAIIDSEAAFEEILAAVEEDCNLVPNEATTCQCPGTGTVVVESPNIPIDPPDEV